MLLYWWRTFGSSDKGAAAQDRLRIVLGHGGRGALHKDGAAFVAVVTDVLAAMTHAGRKWQVSDRYHAQMDLTKDRIAQSGKHWMVVNLNSALRLVSEYNRSDGHQSILHSLALPQTEKRNCLDHGIAGSELIV
jgi:hypothetical protein